MSKKNKITTGSAANDGDNMQVDSGSEKDIESTTAIEAPGAVDTDSESDSDAEVDVDMIEGPTSRPVTPTNAKIPTIKPVTPLKADRKRPRADTNEPPKPTKPTTKEDGDTLRHRLSEGLKDAMTFIQQASVTCPGYTFYGGLIDNLKSAIAEVENPTRLEKPKGLAASSWAGVATDPNGTREPIVIKEPSNSKAPRVKGPQQTTKAKAKAAPKESKGDWQVILRLNKDSARPKLPSHALRNKLNEVIGSTAVTSVELSVRGNIVITTNKPYTASQLLASVQVWKSVFGEYPVEAAEIPTSWIKLVAHGVPILPEIDTVGIFQQEAETFNPIKIKGVPRWLKAPTADKRAGSVVFAVPTEEQATHCRKNGLFIAGVRVKVAVYKAFTNKTQCYRCQGFGHNPATCNKPIACAVCAKRHLTKMHKCNDCSASQQCEHTNLSCVNCKGNHAANNKDCEVYKAIVS